MLVPRPDRMYLRQSDCRTHTMSSYRRTLCHGLATIWELSSSHGIAQESNILLHSPSTPHCDSTMTSPFHYPNTFHHRGLCCVRTSLVCSEMAKNNRIASNHRFAALTTIIALESLKSFSLTSYADRRFHALYRVQGLRSRRVDCKCHQLGDSLWL